MPCLVALLALLFSRVAMVLIWLFSNYLDRAINNIILLLLGFIFLPLTTLAYAFAINSNGSVSGIYLVVLIVAVLVDLGFLGGGNHAWQRRRRGVVV